MASILVTGSKGFVGSHLLPALAEHEVTQLDLYGYEPSPLKEYDGIIHLAAVSRVSAGEKDPVKCLQTNIIETALMLEIPHKWFILASTQEEPVNVYGFSKRAAEGYASLACAKKKTRLEIIRFPVIYGTGDNPNKLIPSVRSGGAPKPGALPIKAMHVFDAVAEILNRIRFLDSQLVIETEEALKRVAASY